MKRILSLALMLLLTIITLVGCEPKSTAVVKPTPTPVVVNKIIESTQVSLIEASLIKYSTSGENQNILLEKTLRFADVTEINKVVTALSDFSKTENRPNTSPEYVFNVIEKDATKNWKYYLWIGKTESITYVGIANNVFILSDTATKTLKEILGEK